MAKIIEEFRSTLKEEPIESKTIEYGDIFETTEEV